MSAGLDDFAGDCAPANPVLIAAADVGRDQLQDDAMLALPAAQRKLRKVDNVARNERGMAVVESMTKKTDHVGVGALITNAW